MTPHFACIGAHKAGTTWLYEQLAKHPQFAMPPIKEFHYFDRDTKYPSPNSLSKTTLNSRIKDISWVANSAKVILNSIRRHNIDTAKWYKNFYFSNYSDDWYLSMFDFAGGRITGDITPSYSILDEEGIMKMRRVLGDTKIIFLLRNPIDRAWSALRYNHQRGYISNLNDSNSLLDHINSPSQELRSNYLRTLDLYCRHFDKKKIIVGFYDAIADQPEQLMAALLKHLGVNNNYQTVSSLKTRVNSSPHSEMPDKIRTYLTEKYREPIEMLSQCLGSYATVWLNNIDKQTRTGSGEEVKLNPVVYP